MQVPQTQVEPNLAQSEALERHFVFLAEASERLQTQPKLCYDLQSGNESPSGTKAQLYNSTFFYSLREVTI